MQRIFRGTFLLVGIVIALGAYGHGFQGRLHIDAELDKYPIASDVYTMLYVVWYFVSGCMLLFGSTVVWAWFRVRRGDGTLLGVAGLIGVLYLAVGVAGFVYRHHDPFMVVFITLGGLLLVSTLGLRGAVSTSAPSPRVTPAPS